MADKQAPPTAPSQGCDAPGTAANGLCGRKVYAKGKCHSHYLFMRTHPGVTLRPLAPRRPSGGVIRRYGIRWTDPQLLQEIEDYATAKHISRDAAIEELLRERMDQLAGRTRKS